MHDQIAKTINLLDKTQASMIKSIENIEDSKKFIKEGKSSLLTKANKMKELGANTKTEVTNQE